MVGVGHVGGRARSGRRVELRVDKMHDSEITMSHPPIGYYYLSPCPKFYRVTRVTSCGRRSGRYVREHVFPVEW